MIMTKGWETDFLLTFGQTIDCSSQGAPSAGAEDGHVMFVEQLQDCR